MITFNTFIVFLFAVLIIITIGLAVYREYNLWTTKTTNTDDEKQVSIENLKIVNIEWNKVEDVLPKMVEVFHDQTPQLESLPILLEAENEDNEELIYGQGFYIANKFIVKHGYSWPANFKVKRWAYKPTSLWN